MAEDTGASADPSMEEILASIRKIISDEVPPAVAEATAEAAPVHEEILELTQMVQSDGSVVDLAVAPVVEPPPAPPVTPAPVTPPPPPPPPVVPVAIAPVAPTETLVSEPAASTAASALSSLASTLEIERLSHAPTGASYLGNGARTLEDMVIELMRPLLKEWLDQNLPQTVERLVQKEIERISRRT